MIPLVFETPEFARLSDLVLREERETCAVGFLRVVYSAGTAVRLIVAEIEVPAEDAYSARTSTAAVLKPEFVFSTVAKARSSGRGLLLLHTHPGEDAYAEFSATDDAGELRLLSYLTNRLDHPQITSVLTRRGIIARVLGQRVPIRVVTAGAAVEVCSRVDHQPDERFDRQVRAFGLDGQAILGDMRVGIVGLGGTGSALAQQLAYLGVRHFALCDFDTVAATNLNRLIGAEKRDVGVHKVEVAKRMILAARPDAQIETVAEDIADPGVMERLSHVDVLFSCTDSQSSRAVMNQAAYQFYLPCIDMGVGIRTVDGKVSTITGRVQMLAPGLPCLTCTGGLDADAVRRELMTPAQRAIDPYISGTHEPQPAVITLNTIVSSLAATMFLSAVTAVPGDARFQLYDGVRGVVRPVLASPETNCIVCSSNGALGRGSEWELPARKTRRQ